MKIFVLVFFSLIIASKILAQEKSKTDTVEGWSNGYSLFAGIQSPIIHNQDFTKTALEFGVVKIYSHDLMISNEKKPRINKYFFNQLKFSTILDFSETRNFGFQISDLVSYNYWFSFGLTQLFVTNFDEITFITKPEIGFNFRFARLDSHINLGLGFPLNKSPYYIQNPVLQISFSFEFHSRVICWDDFHIKE